MNAQEKKEVKEAFRDLSPEEEALIDAMKALEDRADETNGEYATRLFGEGIGEDFLERVGMSMLSMMTEILSDGDAPHLGSLSVYMRGVELGKRLA